MNEDLTPVSGERIIYRKTASSLAHAAKRYTLQTEPACFVRTGAFMDTNAPASANKAQPLVGVIATALSVLLLVGILTFAGSCGVHDDGSVSGCLWASRAVLGTSVVSLLLSVVRIFERDEGERRGLDLGIACTGVLAATLPGTLIDLCTEATMRCHTVMWPFCVGVGAVLALVSAADLTKRLLSLRKA